MTVSQTQFRAAVLDPEQPVPTGLTDPADGPAGRRFSVYRNNVTVSLIDALEVAFPVVRKIVGDDFFRAMAGVYVRNHPPKSPLMMHYGAELPNFLAAFKPVDHLRYLRDVARLELAIRRAYHAADATPIGPEALQTGGVDLMAGRLTLAPAMQVVRSYWPLHDIWRVNTEEGAPQPRKVAQDVLVTRPGYDPVAQALPPGGADFIAALAKGNALGAAVVSGGDGFDPGPVLGLLLAGGAITDIQFGAST